MARDLDELADLRALLRSAERGSAADKSQDILLRILREREALIELLKKSGAVKQVGAENIHAHLDWLMERFLKPMRWPGKIRRKP